MPTFVYKALTPQKQVVKGTIEDANKVGCIKKLKRNGRIYDGCGASSGRGYFVPWGRFGYREFLLAVQ